MWSLLYSCGLENIFLLLNVFIMFLGFYCEIKKFKKLLKGIIYKFKLNS